MQEDFDTPILLIVFKRPEKMRQMIEKLSEIKPKYIYISADGPREHVENEAELCAQARKEAMNIPWQCEIKTNFYDKNLGCKKGVASGVSWFFSHVEAGIILEDDCMPSRSFFEYARTLLKKYQNDERVMHISGTSFLSKINETIDDSYYFSRIPHIWGWATWRRAWQQYDIDMQQVDTLEKKLFEHDQFANPAHAHFWYQLCQHIKRKNVDVWDAQWLYTILNANGISITPGVNLIENIGFGEDATRTKELPLGKMDTESIAATLIHPKDQEVRKDLDAKEVEAFFLNSTHRGLRSILKRWYYYLTQNK